MPQLPALNAIHWMALLVGVVAGWLLHAWL